MSGCIIVTEWYTVLIFHLSIVPPHVEWFWQRPLISNGWSMTSLPIFDGSVVIDEEQTHTQTAPCVS